MAKFRVDLITGLPPIGYVIVEAPDMTKAEAAVTVLIKDCELTSSDDRILFDQVIDPTVLHARPATATEAEEEVVTTAAPVTIHELALHRGMKSSTGQADSFSMADYEAVGLYILGGCSVCAASIAAYNAYPSKTGTWRCENCIGDRGYLTAEEANAAIFGGKK